MWAISSTILLSLCIIVAINALLKQGSRKKGENGLKKTSGSVATTGLGMSLRKQPQILIIDNNIILYISDAVFSDVPLALGITSLEGD